MLLKLSYLEHKHAPAIIFIIAVIILVFTFRVHQTRSVVQADIYGSVADPATLATIQNLQLAQKYLPTNLKIVLHPVMKPDNDQLISYVLDQTKEPDAAQIQVLTKTELTESLRVLAIARFGIKPTADYLTSRYRTAFSIEQVLTALPPPRLLLASLEQSERTRRQLQHDSELFAEIVKKNNLTDFPVPQLLLNGQLYRGSGSPQTLATRVVQLVLRHGKKELPEPLRFSGLGGRLSFALTPPYLINNIPEALTAADCDDRADQTGTVVAASTPYARCSYNDPIPVQATVYGATTTEITDLLDTIKNDIKGLAVTTNENPRDKDETRQIIARLKLPTNFRDLEREPYVIFSSNILSDPAGASYYQSGLFIPLPDQRLLFNTVPFKKK